MDSVPMKLATFEIATPAGAIRHLGAAVDGQIIDLAASYTAHLDRTDPGCDSERLAALLFPPDMVLFLGSAATGRAAADRAIDSGLAQDESRGARTRYSLDEIKLLAPVARPRVLRDFLTFEGHMKQAFKALGRTEPISPLWYQVPAYYKGDPDTVVGPDAAVQIPQYCEKFDFELELAMVVGRRGKNIPISEAAGYIAGYTIWNDFSARDQQIKEGPLGMGPSKAKDFDAGNAVGPYLVTADELSPDDLRMVARVNGEVWTDSRSRGRQFTFPELVAHVSQSETIYPGELWGSGTVPGGSGLELGRYLQPGDTIELEVEGIGTLRNRVYGSTTS